jgi:hypothetical protein
VRPANGTCSWSSSNRPTNIGYNVQKHINHCQYKHIKDILADVIPVLRWLPSERIQQSDTHKILNLRAELIFGKEDTEADKMRWHVSKRFSFRKKYGFSASFNIARTWQGVLLNRAKKEKDVQYGCCEASMTPCHFCLWK